MATKDCSVCFSNLADKYAEEIEDRALPELARQTVVTGKKKNNVVFVSADDLCTCLGAKLIVSDSIWLFIRNRQQIKFTLGSKEMLAINSYAVYDYASNGPACYEFRWKSVLPEAPFIENGKKYVPAELAALQMGALITGNKDGRFTIFDFQVNGKTPYTDTNQYIIGGSWITGWDSYASHKLTPHFKISEIYDRSDEVSARERHQLRVAVTLLESMEAVRHYYRNDASLTLSCAFRNWSHNRTLKGADCRSRHMRGRAFDVPSSAHGTTLYEQIKMEFQAGTGKDEHVGNKDGGFYRTKTSSGKSKGYEIETMPRNDTTWLHLQVKPGVYEEP